MRWQYYIILTATWNEIYFRDSTQYRGYIFFQPCQYNAYNIVSQNLN